MWLLGAGASAAAGVPTADQMTWDFKRTLFCSEERVPLAACRSIEDQLVRDRIQRHLDRGGHPPLGDPEEYAHYFELVRPDERDRRSYIDAQVTGATPSFGHTVLATLMAADRARIIWTTNFDACIETGAARVFDSAGRLVVASPDSSTLANEAIVEERWPLLVKLHGDFRSRRLKNTADELRTQDGRLREALTAVCQRLGLIVVGYSGRDASVMEALEQAIGPGTYPDGLFWIHRACGPPMPAVERLIARAVAAGIDAAVVEAETFDEVMGDVLRQTPDLPSELLAAAERDAPRVGAAPLPAAGTSWPVVRTNALPVIEYPSVCRLVESSIGGVKDVRAAVDLAEVGDELIIGRCNAGVLAFGSDPALQKALANHEPSRTDLHAIEASRLAYSSAEHGLLAEALAVALARERPLRARRRRNQWVLVVDPKKLHDSRLQPINACTSSLVGKLPSGAGHWGEAIGLRLDYRLDQLWMLLEPIVWLTPSRGPRPAKDMDFVRERRARRYNDKFDDLLAAWIDVLLGGEQTARVTAFGGVDGIDAAFVIDKTTAFSRRGIAASAYVADAA
jgi:SIR2-like domain